jgi:glutathione S-transferase
VLKLYYAPNTCALASHISLEDAGAGYETVRLNFAESEQRKPDYLAVNPKGRVPALATDRGILTETPAILAFIAQSFRRRASRRSTTPSRSRKRRPLTAICARPSMSRMPTGCAGPAGPTMRPPLRR